MRHLRYASYLLRHKWFVFLECCKLGIPVRGILHDWSKFLPSEWIPYANFFYGPKAKPARNETGYYKPTDTGDAAFDFAWLLHQKRNRHHWQWWVLPEDDGGEKVIDMALPTRKEMLADWRGAGRAQGHTEANECRDWFLANKGKMRLHRRTAIWIKQQLDIIIGNHTSE